MRKSPTFNEVLVCCMCLKPFSKTGSNQKHCPDCRIIASKETKRRHYKKINPNAYTPSGSPSKCSVCDSPFSSYFDGVPYCNKHYLRMYTNGTLDPIKRKTNRYVLKGDTVEMFTNKGQPFIFDLFNLEKVCKYSWCVSKTGYLVANIDKKVTKLHRYLLDPPSPKLVIDHIDGNPFNNTVANLRICDNIDNAKNAKLAKNNSAGYTGIRIMPSGKYKARIMVNRKEINLGTYDTFDEAKTARIQGEIDYFGEFAPSSCIPK